MYNRERASFLSLYSSSYGLFAKVEDTMNCPPVGVQQPLPVCYRTDISPTGRWKTEKLERPWGYYVVDRKRLRSPFGEPDLGRQIFNIFIWWPCEGPGGRKSESSAFPLARHALSVAYCCIEEEVNCLEERWMESSHMIHYMYDAAARRE